MSFFAYLKQCYEDITFRVGDIEDEHKMYALDVKQLEDELEILRVALQLEAKIRSRCATAQSRSRQNDNRNLRDRMPRQGQDRRPQEQSTVHLLAQHGVRQSNLAGAAAGLLHSCSISEAPS